MAYQRDRIVGVFAGFRTKVIFMRRIFPLILLITVLSISYPVFSLEDKVIETVEDCENNNLTQPFIRIEKNCNNIFNGNFPVGEMLDCDIRFSNNMGRRILIKDSIDIFLHNNIRVEETEGILINDKIELPFQKKNGYFVIEKGSEWNQSFSFRRLNEQKIWKISIYLDCEGKNTLDYIEDRIEVVSKNIFNSLKMQNEALILQKQDSENSFFIAKLSLIVAIVAILASTILAPLISNRFSKNKINKVEITNLKDLNKVLKTNNTKNKLKRK